MLSWILFLTSCPQSVSASFAHLLSRWSLDPKLTIYRTTVFLFVFIEVILYLLDAVLLHFLNQGNKIHSSICYFISGLQGWHIWVSFAERGWVPWITNTPLCWWEWYSDCDSCWSLTGTCGTSTNCTETAKFQTGRRIWCCIPGKGYSKS